jgi:hypothetical protein
MMQVNGVANRQYRDDKKHIVYSLRSYHQLSECDSYRPRCARKWPTRRSSTRSNSHRRSRRRRPHWWPTMQSHHCHWYHWHCHWHWRWQRAAAQRQAATRGRVRDAKYDRGGARRRSRQSKRARATPRATERRADCACEAMGECKKETSRNRLVNRKHEQVQSSAETPNV